jgi:hypothetical protein
MNQAEQQLYFDGCEKAFVLFEARHPEYDQSEESAKRMAAELKVLGLSPLNHEHLEIAWEKIRPATASATGSESADPTELEARRLIDSGEVTADKVRAMSTKEFEYATHNLAFVKAVELLERPAPTRPPTRGEIVREAGLTELAHRGEIIIAPYDPATEVERSRREFNSGFANHQEPKPEPQGGVPHWSGMSFGDRRAAQPMGRRMTSEEARANEAANAARNPQPEKSRGEIVREAQEREAKVRQDRWNR